ncbi:MAG: hypothetical protein ABJD11_01385, partial [Gemmatimonadota bacterium]
MTYRPAGAAESAGELFIDWFNDLDLSENAILIGFAVVIGIGGALGVVAFYKSIDLAYALFYRWPSRYISRVGIMAYRPLITAAGLTTAWWIMRRIGRGH